jgi:HK97 family phage major capsid protein
MRTYAEITQEIEAIEAEQRAITQKDEPSADDRAHLLQAEGELRSLRKQQVEVHDHEVEELRRLVEEAKPKFPASDESRAKLVEFRDRLKGMHTGEDITLVPDGDQRALASNTGSGAALVPQEWHDKVEEYRFEKNWLRSEGATVVRTDSTHNIPVLTANGTAAIVGENTAYTNSEPTIGEVILYAYKLTDKALVSEELIEDSLYDLEGALAKSMGYSFGLAELNYGMTGNGSSQPTGIFNKTTDLTTDTQAVMTANEVLETIYGLSAEYRDDGCVFMMDNTMAYYLAQTLTPVTTSGGQTYMFPGLMDGIRPNIFGYKVKLASAIADKAAGAKVLAFGNPVHYLIGERGPMKVKRLELAEYQTTFAFHQRFDSKPLNEDAFYVVTLHA